jgi:Flp pilus assembly protein TadG
MTRMNLLRLFLRDRRGVAAAEFALIAPALIFLVMGVFEMSYRFRATEEATRYVHQVADLIARETDLTTDGIEELYNASIYLMKPLDTTDNLDLDISSVGFTGTDPAPGILWRRVAGTAVAFDINESKPIGKDGESVIRVGVRYRYHSVLSDLFGGSTMNIEKSAYSRPRIDRKVTLDDAITDGGAVKYLAT